MERETVDDRAVQGNARGEMTRGPKHAPSVAGKQGKGKEERMLLRPPELRG